MNKSTTGKEHPVISELKEKIKECREELLSLLEDWHYMKYILQPRLIFQYECIFGDLEYELKERNKSANELDRRIELLSTRLKRGERLTESSINFINKVVQREFELIEEKNIYFNTNGSGFNNGVSFNKRGADFKKNDEIPHLYRSIVKKLHPDAVGGETEDFFKHWNNVQYSYRESDLEHLSLFYKTLCANASSSEQCPEEEEKSLRKEINELEYNIYKEKRKLERIKKEEPFILEEKMNDKLWVARQKRLLRNKIYQVDAQIQTNERMLKMLTTGVKIAAGRNGLNKAAPYDEAAMQK